MNNEELSGIYKLKIHITYAVPYVHNHEYLICITTGVMMKKSGIDRLYIVTTMDKYDTEIIVFNYSALNPIPVEYVIKNGK